MKKIMFISDYSFYVPGGAQKSMEIIMNGLSDKYNFCVLMPGDEYKSESAKYRCICLKEFETFLVNESIYKTISLIKTIKKIIDFEKPDIIHAHMASGMSVLEVLKKMNLIKSKIIYTERGVADQYSKITRFIIKNMVNNFDRIITTTKYNKQLYLELYLAKSNNMSVIPNTSGPIFENFEYNRKVSSKKELGLQGKVIMLNARNTYNKNWDLSLQIIKWIADNFKCSFIIVIGSDQSIQDKEECNKILYKAKKIVGDKKILTYMDLKLQELDSLYYASDIFIMSSKSESFGRTAIEAMSRGNIVFGTNVDGLAEVIGFNEYRYENLEEFISQFNLFLEKDMKQEQEKFYNRFMCNYSLKTNLELHDKVYYELLHRNKV